MTVPHGTIEKVPVIHALNQRAAEFENKPCATYRLPTVIITLPKYRTMQA